MMDSSQSSSDPTHAAVSWTYVPPDRHEEALLRIRRMLKEHAGWWNDHDERLEREAFERLGIKL
jgi:hypothetical protein